MIYCITFNPAIDKYIAVDDLILENTNYYNNINSVYAGKGQNVSKIISQYSDDYILISKGNIEFNKMIENDLEGINHKLFNDENIRLNIKVNNNGKITELNQEVKNIESSSSKDIISFLEESVDEEDIVLFSGKNSEYETNLIKEFRSKYPSLRIIIDSSNITYKDLEEIKPFMYKPNDEELGNLFGIQINSEEEYFDNAKKLSDIGVEHTIVTLGGLGSIYVSNNNNLIVSSAKGLVVNTVGAGDSFVGGFIHGINSDMEISDVLKFASACGGATAFSSEIGQKKEIDYLEKTIDIKKRLV